MLFQVSGEPYEAECLRLMRKSIERYLQENTIGEVSEVSCFLIVSPSV